MTALLTNGTIALTAHEFDAAAANVVSPIPSAAHVLSFGPQREAIDAAGERLWWGEFRRGDRLELSVSSGVVHGLRAELLDANFNVLGAAWVDHGRTLVRVELQRDGVHYVRARGGTESRGAFIFELRVIRAIAPAREPRKESTTALLRRIAALL
jgi:hypothetical protein